MRASSSSTCFTYGQWTQMNITSNPCRPLGEVPPPGILFSASDLSSSQLMANTSSRPTALPLTTSISSNAGATVPSATIVDCVLDISPPPRSPKQFHTLKQSHSKARWLHYSHVHPHLLLPLEARRNRAAEAARLRRGQRAQRFHPRHPRLRRRLQHVNPRTGL